MGMMMVAGLAITGRADAGITTFIGSDGGAGPGDPRPNSDAAAASFDAAASALGTEGLVNFESAPLGSFSSLTVAPGLTISGSTGTIVNAPTGTPADLYGYNTTPGGSQFLSLYGGSSTFTFSQGVNSFGAYLSGVQFGYETITFSDGSSESVSIPDPSGDAGIDFVGFTDTGPLIASVTINASNDIIGVDDVRYGPTSVPEPASLGLVAIGSIGLLGRRRSKENAN